MNYNFGKLLKKKDDIGCGTYLIAVLFVIALAFGMSCLHAWVGMLLWNWIMPMIWTGAIEMTFWPMWGLIELCHIMFRPVRWSTDNNK